LIATKEEKYIDIESLGPVLFVRSKRPKRLSITIKPHRGIRVAVPARISFKKAREYLLSNLKWVHTNLAHIRKLELQHKTIANDLPKINRTQARKIIIDRLNKLSAQNGFSYNRVSIRNQKTLWGSCSAKNNISLNINLIRLNEKLMDYVIVHELVHTKIKSHSRRFWSELNKYVDNARELDKQLHEHHLGTCGAVN
jgi:predicted metal-dependent hydrolase